MQTKCTGVFRSWQPAVSHIVHIIRPPTDNYTLPSSSPCPRHSKIWKSDDSPGQQTTKHTSIERRHITAVNTRTQDLGNELERKLTLSAARAVESAAVFTWISKRITPRWKISHVITRQNSYHKITFLRKDDQYFMTLNDRRWQWKGTGTMKHWHVRHELWDLNSHGSAFSVPNPRGPLKPVFGSALPKQWMHV